MTPPPAAPSKTLMTFDWVNATEPGGFAVWRVALGEADLSVLHVGGGRWGWLVRRDGADIAEGMANSLRAAQEAAEAASVAI